MITHSGPQTAWLFLFWGIVAILVTRQRQCAQSYVFGATMFAARGLLPWESLWNGVKYYRLAFATLKESYATIQEGEALNREEALGCRPAKNTQTGSATRSNGM
jgi:hypothetical protein